MHAVCPTDDPLMISDAEAESCVCVTLDGEEFLVEFVDVPYDNVSTGIQDCD